MIYLSSIQHSDSRFLRNIQDLSYFQNALICCVVLLILQSPWYYALWLRWRQEPQNRLVEMGPGLWENHQEINQLSPLPSARRMSEDPVSPVASVSAAQGRSFRWGRHIWKGQHSPSLPLMMSYFVFTRQILPPYDSQKTTTKPSGIQK